MNQSDIANTVPGRIVANLKDHAAVGASMTDTDKRHQPAPPEPPAEEGVRERQKDGGPVRANRPDEEAGGTRDRAGDED